MATSIKNGTFEESGHVYRDEQGIEIPSTTQILEGLGLIDLDNIPGATLEHKRQLGDAVHYATRYLDQDTLDWSTVQQEWAGYLVAYTNFCEEMQFVPEPEWIEKSGVHQINGMKYGYTIDRIGRIGTLAHRFLFEIKTAYKLESSWKLQTAAYELAVPKSNGEYIARAALQLKPDGSYKLHLFEDPRDKDAWTWCLAVTHWKIKEKLKWKKDKL